MDREYLLARCVEEQGTVEAGLALAMACAAFVAGGASTDSGDPAPLPIAAPVPTPFVAALPARKTPPAEKPPLRGRPLHVMEAIWNAGAEGGALAALADATGLKVLNLKGYIAKLRRDGWIENTAPLGGGRAARYRALRRLDGTAIAYDALHDAAATEAAPDDGPPEDDQDRTEPAQVRAPYGRATGRHSKPRSDAPVPAQRKCLGCRAGFRPDHKTEFVCAKCKQSPAWKSPGIAV